MPKMIDFNPLSPHGERLSCYPTGRDGATFQSTLPTRGETGWHNTGGSAGWRFQSTLPTRGETRSTGIPAGHGQISIHSPHTGRDLSNATAQLFQMKFQSTLPTRGETANAYNLSARKVVASAQHRLIFDSSLLFPAVQNWFLG